MRRAETYQTIYGMQVVCSRAPNPFGWVCTSVWPQSIRVKLYPMKIDCEEVTPLQSKHPESIQLVVKV